MLFSFLALHTTAVLFTTGRRGLASFGFYVVSTHKLKAFGAYVRIPYFVAQATSRLHAKVLFQAAFGHSRWSLAIPTLRAPTCFADGQFAYLFKWHIAKWPSRTRKLSSRKTTLAVQSTRPLPTTTPTDATPISLDYTSVFVWRDGYNVVMMSPNPLSKRQPTKTNLRLWRSRYTYPLFPSSSNEEISYISKIRTHEQKRSKKNKTATGRIPSSCQQSTSCVPGETFL